MAAVLAGEIRGSRQAAREAQAGQLSAHSALQIRQTHSGGEHTEFGDFSAIFRQFFRRSSLRFLEPSWPGHTHFCGVVHRQILLVYGVVMQEKKDVRGKSSSAAWSSLPLI